MPQMVQMAQPPLGYEPQAYEQQAFEPAYEQQLPPQMQMAAQAYYRPVMYRPIPPAMGGQQGLPAFAAMPQGYFAQPQPQQNASRPPPGFPMRH